MHLFSETFSDHGSRVLSATDKPKRMIKVTWHPFLKLILSSPSSNILTHLNLILWLHQCLLLLAILMLTTADLTAHSCCPLLLTFDTGNSFCQMECFVMLLHFLKLITLSDKVMTLLVVDFETYSVSTRILSPVSILFHQSL